MCGMGWKCSLSKSYSLEFQLECMTLTTLTTFDDFEEFGDFVEFNEFGLLKDLLEVQ